MHICSEKNAVSGANKATIQFHLDPSTTLEDVSFVHLVGTSVTSIRASVKEVLTPADVDRMCSDTHMYVAEESNTRWFATSCRGSDTRFFDGHFASELSSAVKERKLIQHNNTLNHPLVVDPV